MTEVRIATRRSRLARVQAERVAELLEKAYPGLRTRLVPVESMGDRDRSTPVAHLTDVGAFVRSLQAAVLEDRADLAVHSCKDLPTLGPPELVVAAYPERESPLDVLVGDDLDRLPAGARVGTGSPRRVAQLHRLRPDLMAIELRGNVDTRLQRVADGDPPAAVLAEAGLRRLDRAGEVTRRFTVDEMVPAPAQGALAVEARRGSESEELVRALDDAGVRLAVESERDLLARTGAGCRAALGALVETRGSGLSMEAFVEDERGGRRASLEAEDGNALVEAAMRELGL